MSYVWVVGMMLLKNGFVDFTLLTGIYLLFAREKKRHTALLFIANWYLIDLSIRFVLLKFVSVNHKAFYSSIESAGAFYMNLAILTTTIAFSTYFLLCILLLNSMHGNWLVDLTSEGVFRHFNLVRRKNRVCADVENSIQA